MVQLSDDRLDEILRELEKEKKRLAERKKDVEKLLQDNENEIFAVRKTKGLLEAYLPSSTYDRT